MISPKTSQNGFALLWALLAIILVLGSVALAAMRVQASGRVTDDAVQKVLLDEACKAGVDIGIARIWNDYVVGNGNTTGNMASYRQYLNDIVDNNEDLNGNGVRDEGESDLNGNGIFEVGAPAILIEPDTARRLRNGAIVREVTVSRTDDLTGSSLTIRATAERGEASQTCQQTIRISGKLFEGFEFAILANNINCILCHAEIHALDLSRNTDPSRYGTFDRVKVASLESLLYRRTEACSNVAGTVYTRGQIYDTTGAPLSPSQVASSTFKGYSFSNLNGKINQNSSGTMSKTSLTQAQQDPSGSLQSFANLYKDYPTERALMTDGPLPESFPAPYPDDNGNRLVDDDEFARVMSSTTGSISGGIAYGVPQGSTYNLGDLPTASNAAASSLAANGTYSGNLVLVGTEANPIEINGKIAVDGDLVIQGPVKGWGQLMVRGNTYVTGDVTYKDAPGQFGVAEDGTENGLALTSGGSVLMGDYLTIRGKNHTADASKFPDTSLSIRMREARKTKNVTKKVGNKNVTETMEYGYFDPGVVDAGNIQSTMVSGGKQVTRTGQQFSFTTSELMLFNNLEVEKAVADPSYKPRFYGLRESQPYDIYVYDSHDEHSVRYDESGSGVKKLSDYLIDKRLPLSILNNAAIHYMNPTSNWISEDTLRQIWWNDEQTRPRSGRPFQFDGLVYSNNAVFTLTRSFVRHGSYAYGAMRIRGGMVAADLGVLVPGEGNTIGLTLEYDRRVRRFLNVEDTSRVTFSRLVYLQDVR